MKKSLIALAVAGVMAAPVVAQADATLYGKVEALAQFQEDEDANLGLDDVIFGMKGSAETDFDGVSAVYQIEVELNEVSGPTTLDSNGAGSNTEGSAIDTRLAYVGLTGDFGTVVAGRVTNPTDVVEGYGDVSNKAGNLYLNPDRLGAALAYVTPSFSGLDGYAAIVMDGNSTNDANGNKEDVDGYVLGANYAMGGLSLSLAYWSFDEQYDTVAAGVEGALGVPAASMAKSEVSNILFGAGYTVDALTLGFTYEQIDLDKYDAQYELYGVSGTYEIGKAAPYIQYSQADVDGANDEAEEWAVGVNYALGKKASVGVEYIDFDGGDVFVDSDYTEFNVSYTVKF